MTTEQQTVALPNHIKLPVKSLLAEGWKKVYGCKKIFFFSLLIFAAVNIAFTLLDNYYHNWIINLVGSILNILFYAGLAYMGLRRAYDMPLQLSMLFRAFHLRLGSKVIATEIIATFIIVLSIGIIAFTLMFAVAPFKLEMEKLLIAMGYFIGIIIGIYFFLRLSLTTLIVMAQKTGPLRTIALSLQATKGNIWRLLVIFLFSLFIFLLSIVTLGIGFVWTFPYTLILWGLVYKKLFSDGF